MRFVAVLLAWFVSLAAADAAEIRLKDGSVVIGTVLSLTNGEDMVVDTEHMDEVVVDWSGIDRIAGTQIVDIELYDGRRVTGTLSFEDGTIAIDGVDTLRVEASDIFAIEEVNESFSERISANTDLGLNIVRGNNEVTQLSFGVGLGYNTHNYEASLSGSTIVNEQIDAEDTRRVTFGADYTWKFDDGWQATGLYQFESDEQQDLEGRSLVGGTIGKRVFNRRKQRLELFTGLVLNSEKFEMTPQNESLEGILGSRYRLRSFVDFDATIAVLPTLEGDSGRHRVQFDAALTLDVFADLDFKLTFYDRYDSDPPAGNENNDYGTTVGLSWSY